MTLREVRERYLGYFKDRGHVIIPSSRIRPENDPTTLFTSSGMQPLVPFLKGTPHPQGVRLANSQLCLRAEDIEEVGDNRHTTYFEMLGNWSLGDYFKAEQIPWFFNFLVDEVGLPPERLYVTVFGGDEEMNIPRDTESAELWQQVFAERGVTAEIRDIGTMEAGDTIGMQGGRIFYYDAAKNWWSRAGKPANMPNGEIGGPDTEVFFDFGEEFTHPDWKDLAPHPNSDSGRFIEIGNSVFMEYVKTEGVFEKLPKQNVDFGGGLERITAATTGNPDVFLTDVFTPARTLLEFASGASYADPETAYRMRVILDHLRGSVMVLADGAVPQNTDAGYVLRRLIRRAVRMGDGLSLTDQDLVSVLDAFIDVYAPIFEHVSSKREHIRTTFHEEVTKFRATLAQGLKIFERHMGDTISGEEAFVLFTTYGFPFELTLELAKEKGKSVDTEGFQEKMKEHQDASRKGAEQKFKGGMLDQSEMSVKYHTATHLLHKALKSVLGESVEQRGSNITPERLRFDFAWGHKMTEEEKKEVEALVNEQIKRNLPVTFEDLPLEEAKTLGAIGLFEEKYGNVVRVYSIGDYSLEFCGGPHVLSTGDLGTFVIQKEEAVASGIRRIKAVLT